jgi:hypothetical protein
MNYLYSVSVPVYDWFVAGGPLLPPYHTPFLSLLSVRQNGVHGIAGSLAHLIATFVLSCLVSPCQ